MNNDMLMIDGLQYVNWNRGLFEQAQRAGLHAIHVTIAYWENSRETLENIGHWNRHFLDHGDLIMPVKTAADVLEAQVAGLHLGHVEHVVDDVEQQLGAAAARGRHG